METIYLVTAKSPDTTWHYEVTSSDSTIWVSVITEHGEAGGVRSILDIPRPYAVQMAKAILALGLRS